MKKIILLLALVMALTASNAIASTIELDDSVLQTFTASGWWGGESLATSDIAGDPGTQWDITYGSSADFDFFGYAFGGLGVGDTWSITLTNPDASNYYWIDVWGNDASWTWFGGDADYLYAGETKTFTLTIPGTGLARLGIGAYPYGWGDGDTATLQVTPEPATIALLGLGGLALRRRKRKA